MFQDTFVKGLQDAITTYVLVPLILIVAILCVEVMVDCLKVLWKLVAVEAPLVQLEVVVAR